MDAPLVLDTSAFLRAAERHAEASTWIQRIEARETETYAPDLIYAEVANALAIQTRKGFLSLEAAVVNLDVLRRLTIRNISLREVAVPALRLAEKTGLTAYDACYVAVADHAEAVLVTADRRLAQVTERSVLIT